MVLRAKTESKLISGRDVRIAILQSTYHEEITGALVEGAIATLERADCKSKQREVFQVPGVYEIPIAARYILSGNWNAVIALGAVIRGETDHYQHICTTVERGCMDVQLNVGKPIGFGILTSPSWELAKDRAGGQSGNKGEEAAAAVLSVLLLIRRFGS